MLSAASQLLLLMKWRSLRSFLGADFPASAKSAPRKLRVNCSTIFGSAWKSYRLRYSLSSRLCYIMSTKEKQATLKAAFVFLVPLENEQPAKQAVEHVSAGSWSKKRSASGDSRAVHRKGRSRLLITGSFWHVGLILLFLLLFWCF